MSMDETGVNGSGPRRSWVGLRVLVVGLGRFGGGVGVTRWLASQGAVVTVTDQADAGSLASSLAAIADLDVGLVLGGHDACDLEAADLAIINPAVVKGRSSLFVGVEQAGIPWTTELNLFCERCPAPVVGVTGSYGKSTTCAMLAHVLWRAVEEGRAPYTAVHLGGNIGRSLLADLDGMRATDLVILELSNAQLEDLPRVDWAARWAVVTNLHPHHLDRYPDAEAYYSAKLNLLRHGDAPQTVVAGELETVAERMLVAALGTRANARMAVPTDAAPLVLRTPGKHNQANARCALTVIDALGLDGTFATTALETFAGLPHRLEFVRELDGVRYFNDSKSTAPEATKASVEALDRPSVVIVGGQDKAYADYAGCASFLAESCRVVVCTGESAQRWAQALRQAASGEGSAGSLEVEVCKKLTEAVAVARRGARPGDAVLFSPGAPSFDAYANFAERGVRFRALVDAMVAPAE